MSDRAIVNFILSRGVFLLAGSFLVSVSILMVSNRQLGSMAGFSLALLGSCALFVALRGLREVLTGKVILEKTVSLLLPGKAVCELTTQSKLSGGTVLLFFEGTTERYAGEISLSKIPSGSTSPVLINLPRLDPSRIKVPTWSPTSDAGHTIENWPRRTGQSPPALLKFSFPVEAGERLQLEFDLESNFKGTRLESRFPITGTEAIHILVKSGARR